MKIECPYCGKSFFQLTPGHLRKHGKTRADIRKDFPEIPAYFTNGNIVVSKSNPNKDVIGYFRDKQTDQIRYAKTQQSKWMNNKGILRSD